MPPHTLDSLTEITLKGFFGVGIVEDGAVGHAMVHSLHPTHMSSLTTLAPTGEMVIASTGQATRHHASAHCVQV